MSELPIVPAQTLPTRPDFSLRNCLDRIEARVRSDPAKALAAAFGVGLALKLLPPRTIARTVSSMAAKLLPPTLLALGVLKATELCCDHADESPHGRNRTVRPHARIPET